MLTDYAHHLKGDVPQSVRAACSCPHRLVERRRLSGAVAGQQQQGHQLRPALGGSGGDPQDRGSPAEPGDRPARRRDDLPGRREADRQQPAGTGADDRRHDQRRRRAGHRHPPAGRALGLARRWPVPTDAPRQALHAVYDALVAAADFYALRNLHKSGFDYPDAADDVPGLRDRSFTASTNSTGTSARPPTAPRSKAGTSSSRCGPTSRPITSTGI